MDINLSRYEPTVIDALKELGFLDVSGVIPENEEVYLELEIISDNSKPTWPVVLAKWQELKEEYLSKLYARNRQAEYPSLLELTVALYDTDDKSAVEAKRAAVKLKYPKP